ncbi:MAG TPA: DUF2817 domain-containing protein [Thermoleophilaceae bacterium]
MRDAAAAASAGAACAACAIVAAATGFAGPPAAERRGAPHAVAERAAGARPASPSATVRALVRGSREFPPGAPRVDHERTIGRSARGRRLGVTAFGTPRASPKVLVVGCIHGTECAGTAVADRIAEGCPPADADVWTVRDLNPDGRRLHTRLNGRGVDLNRNFPAAWRPLGARWNPQYSGPRPLSEPEARVARDLIRWLRPAVTIWYHQGEGPYVRAWGPSVSAARRYAAAAGMPFRALPWLAGTAPHWQNRTSPGTASFVVELPAGPLSRAAAVRHAAAVELLAGYRGANRGLVGGSGAEGR